jgi:uncharacterized protein (TIGR02246 family)
MLQARRLLATLLALAAPASAIAQQPATPAPAPAPAPAPTPAPARPEDEAAIQAVIARFVQAFDAGDAPAAAAQFAEDGQIEAIDGTVVRGREAIAARYAEYLADAKGATLALTPESYRFVGPDGAVAGGRMVLTRPDGDAESSRFQAVFARRDGRWLLADVRDLPDAPPTPYERLKDLEWLVGEWMDESDEGTVRTTCAWDENKAFLVRKFEVEIKGQRSLSGHQRLGWDPSAGQIKSWVFDSEGGHGEGYWSRSGDRWIAKSTSVLPDGRRASATQVITRTGPDTMTWSSVERTVGDEVVADLPPITVVRRPPPPK